MRSQERLQDLRAGHGRPGRRHGQRGGPLARGLQEVAPGDGRRHAGAIQPRVLQHLLARPAAGVLAARAGSVRPARRSRCTPARATRITAPIAWDEALDRIADQAASRRSPTRPSSTPAAVSNEAGFLLQLFARLYGTNYVNNCSLLLPPGHRRRAGQRLGTRHRDGHARRRRARRPGLPHRRQPGVRTIRG